MIVVDFLPRRKSVAKKKAPVKAKAAARQPDLDRAKIVEAFKVPWKERKRAWPPELPHPYNILYEDWVAAFIWELHAFAATLSIKQLGVFIEASTGKIPRNLDFPGLCNEARKLLDYALCIDPQSGEDHFKLTDTKLVSKLWSVDITEEVMAKKKGKTVEKVEGTSTEAVVTTKERKGKEAFAPPPVLKGISILASLQLHQIAEALTEDYGDVPEVVEMAKRTRALSDAFAGWGDVT
jgi:hypothetical protein